MTDERTGAPTMRFLILSDEDDLDGLAEILGSKLPGHPIELARTRSDLDAALQDERRPIRLLSFCSSVIVPSSILRSLGLEAYNIHPGSPAYPGSFPACWAVYEGARRFGATLHAMRPRVDEGAIVDVRWCEVDPAADSSRLARQASAAAFKLLLRWAPVLATTAGSLSPNGETWNGPKRRVAELALIEPGAAGISQAERSLRDRSMAQAIHGPAAMSRMLRPFKKEAAC